ncbi:uncharacterized protein VP01_14960g1, partial [Puccinia sorghi]
MPQPSLFLARYYSILPPTPTNSPPTPAKWLLPFMTDHVATWSQPYLMEVFNVEEVAFNKFLSHPPTISSAPTTDPNAMDLSAFQLGPHNQLSDADRTFWVQLNLCFHCGQAGHVSCGCSNGNRKLQ